LLTSVYSEQQNFHFYPSPHPNAVPAGVDLTGLTSPADTAHDPTAGKPPFTSTRDDKVPPGLAAVTALDHTAAKPPSLSPDAVSVGFAVRSTLNWLVITTENVSLAAGQRRG
jgi:hypothetical protein